MSTCPLSLWGATWRTAAAACPGTPPTGCSSPILSALGLINSLGVSHLGISPDTLRVTKDSTLLITGFSIVAARREGTGLEPELAPGFAALEQYSTKAPCGEASDVYGFAATLLYAITGQAPWEATRRMKDQRLMISKEVLHSLPPFAVTAIANALQVRRTSAPPVSSALRQSSPPRPPWSTRWTRPRPSAAFRPWI